MRRRDIRETTRARATSHEGAGAGVVWAGAQRADAASGVLLVGLALIAVSAAAGCRSGGAQDRVGVGGMPGLGDGGGGASAATGGHDGVGPSGMPVPPGGAVPRPAGPAGNLTVLDWAGFKAAVSYTFDDANSSQLAHYTELQALGVRMTFYLITGKTEASDPTWAQAVRDGHELGNHSKSHLNAGTGADVDAATDFLAQTFGVTAWTMASPFGDPSYPPLAATRFLINRGVVNGLMAANDNTDPFNLSCYIPPQGAAAAAFNAQIDAAHDAGRWRVVLVHGFIGGTDGAYLPVSIDEFTASVNHTKASGDVWIDSVVNVGAYWRGQKVFSSVTPVTAGGAQTWTWTLPAHFPPRRFLRVRIDGGSLTQGGTPLPWDDHGYYEVALDAGSLTLSP